jgi:hypothetical protein
MKNLTLLCVLETWRDSVDEALGQQKAAGVTSNLNSNGYFFSIQRIPWLVATANKMIIVF